MLLLFCFVAFLGRGTLSLLHSLFFVVAFEAALFIVLGVFVFFVFKLLAPRPTPLRAAPVLVPRPRHRPRRETDVLYPRSCCHARRCPQADSEVSKDQP
jgi:hypothetical protein